MMITKLKDHTKKVNRHIKNPILSEHYNLIEKVQQGNCTGRFLNGLIHELIENTKHLAPWLIYTTIMWYYHMRVTEVPIIVQELLNVSPNQTPVDDKTAETNKEISHKLGGQPKGNTDKKIKMVEVNLVATVNQIALEYHTEHKKVSEKKRSI